MVIGCTIPLMNLAKVDKLFAKPYSDDRVLSPFVHIEMVDYCANQGKTAWFPEPNGWFGGCE